MRLMAKFPELDEFVEKLRADGLRVTRERLQLFREVYAQHGHIDAEALLRGLKKRGAKISRATLYRNLDLIADYGFVTKQRLAGKRFHYEHVHGGQRHDHVVCEFISPAMNALQREICYAHGFDPEEHSLQIRGLCLECSRSRQSFPRSG